jgi:hypothetical protein
MSDEEILPLNHNLQSSEFIPVSVMSKLEDASFDISDQRVGRFSVFDEEDEYVLNSLVAPAAEFDVPGDNTNDAREVDEPPEERYPENSVTKLLKRMVSQVSDTSFSKHETEAFVGHPTRATSSMVRREHEMSGDALCCNIL